jgi:hypothetical protein
MEIKMMSDKQKGLIEVLARKAGYRNGLAAFEKWGWKTGSSWPNCVQAREASGIINALNMHGPAVSPPGPKIEGVPGAGKTQMISAVINLTASRPASASLNLEH